MAESDQGGDHSRPTATERQPRPGRPADSSHSQVAGDPSAERPPVAPLDVKMDSETETESENDAPAGATSSGVGAQTANDLLRRDSSAQPGSHASPNPSRGPLPASGERSSATRLGSQNPETPAGSSSRSPPPSKKPKLNAASRRVEDSDSDSSDSLAGKASQASQSNAGAGRGRGGPARGVRQPLKRGVKRF